MGKIINVTKDKRVQKEIITEGTGEGCKRGDKVKVHYTGWLADGTKFDSSLDRGEPFEFTIGSGVIDGWSYGVASMKVGEKSKFTLHYSYGYGHRGCPPAIPPRATLVFEIELLEKE